MDERRIIITLANALNAAIRWGEFSGHLEDGVPKDGGWDMLYRDDVDDIRLGLSAAEQFSKDSTP